MGVVQNHFYFGKINIPWNSGHLDENNDVKHNIFRCLIPLIWMILLWRPEILWTLSKCRNVMKNTLVFRANNGNIKKVIIARWRLTSTLPLHNMSNLLLQLLQCLCLNETCRMIGYSILSNNVNLVEIGFQWLWRKTTFLSVLMRISPTKSTFSLGKIFWWHLDAKKMNPPSIVLGGGVHGKVCWLIAYKRNYSL